MAKDYHHHTCMLRIRNEDKEYIRDLHYADPDSLSMSDVFHKLIVEMRKNNIGYKPGNSNVTINEMGKP